VVRSLRPLSSPDNAVSLILLFSINVELFFCSPFINNFKETTTLSNGIRVVTEKSGSQVPTVGVYVGAGSRQDTLETTGASHALQKMLLRGTSQRSKHDFAEEIEAMGARFNAESHRERTAFQLKVFKGDLDKAVALLGDAVTNSTLDGGEVELLKQEIAEDLEVNHTRYEETTMENVHFNVFREHMMGQPIKGDRDQIQNLNSDSLRNFHAANYYGDNIVIVGTGDINHEAFVDQVNQHFHTLSKTVDAKALGTEKPIYIPALLYIRDDEMVNSNVGVFYDAPSIKDADYYGFLLLQNMFGQYRIDQHAEHLNDVKK